MHLKTALILAAMTAAFSVHANDLSTGVGGALGGAGGATGNAKTGAAIGGAIGGGAGAAVGNKVGGANGAIIGAGVGGAAGAVVGGSMTADSGKPQTNAQQAAVPAAQASPTGYSCNRNNPGKGRALGHCKH
jgi:hypothetical protein